MQRSIDLMQQRVNEFGVAGGRGLPVGRRTRSRSTSRASRTPSEIADQVGSTAQLFFYDWEANILDENCETDADTNSQQRQPVNGLHAAVTQASKCTSVGVGRGLDPLAEDSPGGESQAAAEPRFYVFDKATKKPLTTAASRRSTRAGRAGLR